MSPPIRAPSSHAGVSLVAALPWAVVGSIFERALTRLHWTASPAVRPCGLNALSHITIRANGTPGNPTGLALRNNGLACSSGSLARGSPPPSPLPQRPTPRTAPDAPAPPQTPATPSLAKTVHLSLGAATLITSITHATVTYTVGRSLLIVKLTSTSATIIVTTTVTVTGALCGQSVSRRRTLDQLPSPTRRPPPRPLVVVTIKVDPPCVVDSD